MNDQQRDLFLLQGTIPSAQSKRPDGLKKSNLLWDAIWRAHRDVTPARFHLPDYVAQVPSKDKPNAVPVALYEIIASAQDASDLSSANLIACLQDRFSEYVEFSAIQKLVNMTLKYLLVIQTFGDIVVDGTILPNIDPSNCDCPVDSTILRALGIDDFVWTAMTEAQYIRVQELIDAIPEYPNRIDLDLDEWTGAMTRSRFCGHLRTE